MIDTGLIQALQHKALYPHKVTECRVIETHLSWVILTGLYAYKIKKPLNLGFQDFTTLEKRRYYCELECALNKRLAKEIYLEVIPISGTPLNPEIAGKGPPIEYAIKMRQFSQECLLTVLAHQQHLSEEIIKDLANQLAVFHQSTAIADIDCEFGSPFNVFSPMQDNFRVLKNLSDCYFSQITQIEQWVNEQYHQLEPQLSKRKQQGFIRACHGDLHLGNMVLYQGKPLIFDCIEFNESFRWIDVVNDIGFLTMDLLHKDAPKQRALFLNKYLESTYDYHGLLLLRFYESYRAMVRAKVLSIQLSQEIDNKAKALELRFQIETFLKVAMSLMKPAKPQLTLTFGVSGTGKTVYTEQLLMTTQAIRLRSDVCRKQLHGLLPLQLTPASRKEQLYSEETTKTVYTELKNLARMLLKANYPVIIDATCLKAWQRELFLDLADTLGISAQILSFDAPVEKLRERIHARLSKGSDASDANDDVLMMQLEHVEPLSKKELQLTTAISMEEINKLIKN